MQTPIGEIKLKESWSLVSIVIAFVSLLYVVSPIDFIPDFIPIIGWIDDFAILCIAGITLFTGAVKR